MPTTGKRQEDALIDLFLSVYEDRSWSGQHSTREHPERFTDRGVEVIATRKIDGLRLAIEHTLIEPFVGEKSDFHKHFKEFARQLRADETLEVPGAALYINAPVNVLPYGSQWRGIITDVCSWLREHRRSFPTKMVLRDCPSSHHPEGKVTFQVRLQPLGSGKGFVITQRYGDMDVSGSVKKALVNKLPKLVATDVDRRVLMLERDQGWVYPEEIYKHIGLLRPEFPELSRIDEVWIADTASFDDKKEYVDFQRREGGEHLESYTFFQGRLQSIARNNMPIPMSGD
jgi:hypothetical protein